MTPSEEEAGRLLVEPRNLDKLTGSRKNITYFAGHKDTITAMYTANDAEVNEFVGDHVASSKARKYPQLFLIRSVACIFEIYPGSSTAKQKELQ